MSSYPDDKCLIVEQALERFFPPETSHPDVLFKAMRYSLFSGGKRFRPVLTLLVAEALGQKAETVLPTACAIEYIHTYSLIHDDLPAIDNDDLRRGRPTCHKVFGEDIALMAGDALFAEAFKLVSDLQKASDSDNIIGVLSEIANAGGATGMVGGQVVDIISTGKEVDLETVQYIHSHKTGRLIRAAARCGAILSGASDEELTWVTKYGEHLGLAFQITDDILDVVGSVEELGKTPGADKLKDKATYPAVAGLDEARRAAERHIEQAKRAVGRLDKTQALQDLADFVVERTR